MKALKRKEIRPEVARIIERDCPSVLHVAPFIRSIAKVKSGRLSADDVYIEGTNEDAQYMTEIGLEAGRYFTPYEIEHASPVCIIGADISEKIFASPDPTGKTVYIKGHRFTVIGSHARMGTVLGISRDAFVYVPYTTFERIFGRGFDAEISVRARSPELVAQATGEVRSVMRRLRRLGP